MHTSQRQSPCALQPHATNRGKATYRNEEPVPQLRPDVAKTKQIFFFKDVNCSILLKTVVMNVRMQSDCTKHDYVYTVLYLQTLISGLFLALETEQSACYLLATAEVGAGGRNTHEPSSLNYTKVDDRL